MKCLTTSLSGVELEYLRPILQQAGISCYTRDPARSDASADTAVCVELWVERDEDFLEARALIKTWKESPPGNLEIWACPACGQRMSAQLDSCRKCGTHRNVDDEMAAPWAEVDRRAREMSSVLEEILHHQ